MCGIAGYFGLGSIADERVDTALSLMHRRGPDHRASLTWASEGGRHCCLLHSRLNIIDLDPRSNQPFSVGAKRIVFNGEL